MKLPFALARRFVAGETFDQSIPKVRHLNEHGIKVTLDLLGENVRDRKTADSTVDDYIGLLQNIYTAGLKSTISVKLTMMGLDIDTDYCKDNLYRLLDEARDNDSFVRIDMEGSDYTQVTIDLFKDAFRDYGRHVGIVLQAYLHRTKEDVAELAELGADVRICKGAYKEPSRVALQDMAQFVKLLKNKQPFCSKKPHFQELQLTMMN